MADRQLIQSTYTIVASPVDATETVIASVGNMSSLFAGQTFKLHGWCSLTPAASATSLVLKIHRTSLTGTLVATSPTYNGSSITTPKTAEWSVYGSDTQADTSGTVYVMTVTVAGVSAGSTVAAVYLEARVD